MKARAYRLCGLLCLSVQSGVENLHSVFEEIRTTELPTTLHSYYRVANIIYISLYYMYIFRGYPLFNLVREYLSQYSLQSYQAEQSAGHMEINVIFNNCCLIIIFIIYFLTGEGEAEERPNFCVEGVWE